MKDCSQRNTGETYRGVSQLSRHEGDYKKFRAATAVATRERAFVIKPSQVQSDAPVFLFAALASSLPLSPCYQY